MSEKQANPLGAVIGLVVFGGMLWFYFGGGLEQQTARSMGNIYTKVADDAEAQYDIAKRSGSAMDACVQAGMVAAAHLQAKNETQYRAWKATESTDCQAAGLPR